MKLSQRLQDEKAFVEQAVGESVICETCGATLGTYATACTASLSDPCPGFLAKARAEFAQNLRIIHGEPVHLPANAVMGAEFIQEGQ